MNPLPKIEFAVDETYENEKGVFKVISIHRNQMVIRWESGEEIRTDVELQKRILERRQWEHYKRAAEKEAAAKPSGAGASAGKNKGFGGFKPTDFKKTAAGTTWRSRTQLGTAITAKIGAGTVFAFNSWAFGRNPEMHVQDNKHRGRTTTDHQARFFVRLDGKTLTFGFRVARPEDPDAVSADWNAFCEWVAEAENEKLVQTIAAEENLIVASPAFPAAGTLKTTGDGWQADSGQKGTSADGASLSQYLADAPQTGPFEVEIAAAAEKEDALAEGPDIAETIARLFDRLLPLYRAAVIPG